MGKKATHETINYLSSFLVKQKAYKQQEDLTRMVTLKEVEEELAEYCSISRNAIIAIKRGESQPSLAVALLISEYFQVPVEDIFVVKKLDD